MMKARSIVIIILTVVFIAAGNGPSLSADYTVTDLGALGSYNRVYDINESGQVVGRSVNSCASIYSDGTWTDIGTWGSSACGINDSGQVTGFQGFSGYEHAFLYSNGTMTDLGLIDGNGESEAYDINENGQVVGESQGASFVGSHAFLYSNGTMTDLGTLGGNYSVAKGINDNGQVVGYSYTAGNTGYHAFLYSGDTMADIGTLGGSNSQATGVNNSGQVTGFSQITGNTSQHAFLYSSGTMTDLGTLSSGSSWSMANGINNSGHIVGCADSFGNDHAFLYRGGLMIDLNSLINPNSGWTLWTATGINDGGQIIGLGGYNGEQHAFILSPNPIVTITPSNHDFGIKAVGWSSTQQFTVENMLDEDLTIDSLSLAGINTSEFEILNDNCTGAALAPHGIRTFDVAFTAGSCGAKAATVNISIPSQSDDPITVSLTARVTQLCEGDLNSDGRMDMLDWLLFGQRWGAVNCNTVPCACDLNHDGRCDMRDWLIFGQDWGRTDCPVQ